VCVFEFDCISVLHFSAFYVSSLLMSDKFSRNHSDITCPAKHHALTVSQCLYVICWVNITSEYQVTECVCLISCVMLSVIVLIHCISLNIFLKHFD